jgi:hypothetical protein
MPVRRQEEVVAVTRDDGRGGGSDGRFARPLIE